MRAKPDGCSSYSEKVYDRFAEMLAEKVRAFKVGPGFDEGVTHGPLIHMRQADKVQEVSRERQSG